MRLLLPSLWTTTLVLSGCAPAAPAPAGDAARAPVAAAVATDPWYAAGEAALDAARQRTQNDAPARNVILFIGDGMSLPTVTAARILEGQLRGEPGEENALTFERLPWTGLSKTYTTNAQVADSAGTATAMLSGVKTKSEVIGVSSGVVPKDCASGNAHAVPSLLELAEDAGLATGVVTTTRVTHATPAAAYAHVAWRDWESDADLPPSAAGCVDIARQLVELAHGDGVDVVLGGGRSKFMPEDRADPEDARATGERHDGRDLVQGWRERYGAGGAFVWSAKQLAAIDRDKVQHLLGLFEPSHMHYEVERAQDPAGEPSLSEMTRTAIELLGRRSGKGFFLLVEGGRIDHAHHAGNAHRALHETIEFANAVRVALELTKSTDTLVVVTADHGHVFDIGGWPARGNPILGKVRSYGDDGTPEAADSTDLLGLPYTTLTYANGPGYTGASDAEPEGAKHYPHEPSSATAAHGRPDLTKVDTTAPDYLQETIVPLDSETHSGADVPVYASGPASYLLSGAYEQNYIYHVMRHALRL